MLAGSLRVRQPAPGDTAGDTDCESRPWRGGLRVLRAGCLVDVHTSTREETRVRRVIISIVDRQAGANVTLIVSEDNLPVVMHALIRCDAWGDIEIIEPLIVPE